MCSLLSAPVPARVSGAGQPPWVRAGPEARRALSFQFLQPPPSLPWPISSLLASWLPRLFLFPFETPAAVPGPSRLCTKASWIPASAPEASSVIQLRCGGFLLSFPPLPLPSFLPFFFSFLDQNRKDRHCDPQKTLGRKVPFSAPGPANEILRISSPRNTCAQHLMCVLCSGLLSGASYLMLGLHINFPLDTQRRSPLLAQPWAAKGWTQEETPSTLRLC